MKTAAHILSFLILLLALSACKQVTQPQQLLGTLEWDRVELLATESEPIVQTEVVQGEQVEPDQLLLVLDPALAKFRVEGAIAAREQSRARLDEVLRGPREERIAEAQAVLAGAESRLHEAQLEVTRQQELVTRKLASEATLDRMIASRDNSAAQRESAAQSLSAATAGNTDEEIRQARFALQVAQTEVAVQERALQRLSVYAPVAGVIDSLPLKTGTQARVGEVLAVLLAGRPYARVYLPEPLKAGVQIGDQFAVRIDGVPDLLMARVRYLSREAAFTPYFSLAQRDRSRLVFEMELEFEDPEVSELAAGIPLQVLVPDLLP